MDLKLLTKKIKDIEEAKDSPLLFKVYNLVMSYGFIIRYRKLQGEEIDGLKSWNDVKSKIPKIGFIWGDRCLGFYKRLKELNVKGDDDNDPNEKEWEPHHFLIQHGRIINNNPDASLQRLLQISYNTGQLSAELGHGDISVYSEDMVRFIQDSGIFNLTTFIAPENKGLINFVNEVQENKEVKALYEFLIGYIKDYLKTNDKGEGQKGGSLVSNFMPPYLGYISSKSNYFNLRKFY